MKVIPACGFMAMRRPRPTFVMLLGAVTVLLLSLLGVAIWSDHKPVATVNLEGGRLLLIERVRYGTRDRIGGGPRFLSPVLPWLPKRCVEWLWKDPGNEMLLPRPGLMIWARALDLRTRKSLQFQGTCQFVDANGDVYTCDISSGGVSAFDFRRQFFGFTSYPRAERVLRLMITEDDATSYMVRFPNPHVTQPTVIAGQPPPLSKQLGEYEIHLESVRRKPCPYLPDNEVWEPTWALRRSGHPAHGWEPAWWSAEDCSGNRLHFPGGHQKALRFEVLFYPSLTNLQATIILTNSPWLGISQLETNTEWNLNVATADLDVRLVGIFAGGTHCFSNGVFRVCPPSWWTPSVGAPSQWAHGSHRASSRQREEWDAHTSEGPAVYLWINRSSDKIRTGVRLRGDDGKLYTGQEMHGGRDGEVRAYLLENLPERGSICVELVRLDPLRAIFDVDLR